MTQEKLKEILHYNPDNGIFTWLINANYSNKKGTVAGRLSKYYQIQYKNKKYYSHRLAWLYIYGEHPKNQIDHINRDKTDNRISNLRDITDQENKMNKENLSVCYINYKSSAKRWIVTLSRSYNNGKTKHIASLKTEVEAINVAIKITREYGKA